MGAPVRPSPRRRDGRPWWGWASAARARHHRLAERRRQHLDRTGHANGAMNSVTCSGSWASRIRKRRWPPSITPSPWISIPYSAAFGLDRCWSSIWAICGSRAGQVASECSCSTTKRDIGMLLSGFGWMRVGAGQGRQQQIRLGIIWPTRPAHRVRIKSDLLHRIRTPSSLVCQGSEAVRLQQPEPDLAHGGEGGHGVPQRCPG